MKEKEKEKSIKERVKFYGNIVLPNQDPEIVLSAIDSLPTTLSPDLFEYDPDSLELCFLSVQAYLTYSDYLWREWKREFGELTTSPLSVIYGKEDKITSSVPFFWSTEGGKNPRVKLGEGEKNTYVVSNRGRDENRKDLVDTVIFPETLCDPLEMDYLVEQVYRSSARIKYGDYIRAFQIPYHLGAFPEITSEVRFIRDLERQRLKYRLDRWEDYKAFGPDGWNSDFASLPIRAIQWYDSPDDFGIWIKPGNFWGPTELPPGKPLLLNGKYASVEDLSFYLFANNCGILYSDRDPRFIYLKTDLIPWLIHSLYGDGYGMLDQVLFNEAGWVKPKTQRKGSSTLPIYDLEEFMNLSCPQYKYSGIPVSSGIDSPIKNWITWLITEYCYLGIPPEDLTREDMKAISRMKYMARMIL